MTILVYYVAQRISIDILTSIAQRILCILIRCATIIFVVYSFYGGDIMAERKAKWQNEYITRKYDRVNLTVPKGMKEKLQAHAEARGESVNGFINRAINQVMASDESGGFI